MKQNQGQSHQAVELIRESFAKIDSKLISQFCLTVFPVSLSAQSYENLYLALTSLSQIKRKASQPYSQIRDTILKKGQEFSPAVKMALESLYAKEQFNRLLQAEVNCVVPQPNSSKEVIQLDENSKEKEAEMTLDTKRSVSRKNNGSQKSGSARPQPKKLASHHGGEIDHVKNISGGGVCACEKEVVSNSFNCTHCNYPYHFDCMKRKEKIKHCSMCHLKMLLPNKAVRKTLFLGFLRKGKRKHEFSIYLSEEDLALKHRLQVRCFRIKESTQNFVLFPDHTEICVNGVAVKEFNPLHRQSALKYRKDEPFYIDWKQLLPKENKVTVAQKLPSKELKDVRIELETHLIGFFLVEDKKVEALVAEFSHSAISTFEESKRLLDSSYILSHGQDSVSCEVVKIPLTCTLSTQKLKLPARGIFCNHYQCFDLQNCLMMISQSANPRWVCPLCKLPCYMFKIDCILLAILEKFANHPLTEVMLFKSGDFTVNAGDNPVTEKTINISELPIQSLAKRAASHLAEPDKKKKKTVVSTEAKQVIAIDLD